MEEYTRLVLIRHGETINAHLRCYNGHTDVDLSPEGHAQIRRLINAIGNGREDVSAIYSSDLKRAIISAEILASHFRVKVFQDKRLREVGYGRWEGLPLSEIRERYPDEAEQRFADMVNFRIKDGGENLLDLSNRVMPAISEIINCYKNKTVCVVAHSGVNRLIISWALNMKIEDVFRIKQDFASLNIINFYKDRPIVELINGSSLNN